MEKYYRNFYVISGPKKIATKYGVYGFMVPAGKHAVVYRGKMNNGQIGDILQLGIVFDNRSDAEQIASKLQFRMTSKERKLKNEGALDDFPLLDRK